jgi:hypothetical protein
LPVPRNEFDKGKVIKPLQQRFLDFLSKNRGSAYTAIEIVREVIQPEEHTSDDVLRFGAYLTSALAALDILEAQGKVVRKLLEVGSVRDIYFTVP